MRTAPVVAVLQTGATETSYHRAGVGPPVLLLYAAALADPLGAALFAALATEFRVIAPVLPPGVGVAGGVAVSRWLRDLIDGLGLERPGVIADAWFAGPLLGFVLMDRARVGGVAAVCRDHVDPHHDGAVEDELARSAHRLMVVLVDAARAPAAAAAEAAAQLVPFLRRATGAG